MKNLTNKNLGTRLKKLRQEVYMEQDLIAKILNIPRTAVSAIENGTRDVSVQELSIFCKVFRRSPNELLLWNNEKSTGE